MTLALLPDSLFRWTLRWRTDVRQAWDGGEQRAATSTDPRVFYDGAFVLADDRYAEIRQMLSSGPAGTFELPLVPEATPATAAITGTAVTIDATYVEWAVFGRRVLVVGPSGRGYKATITAAAGGSLTLSVSPPGGEAYPAAVTMLYPLEDVRLDDGQQLARWPVNVGRWGFTAEQATARELLGTGATVATFDGLHVLDRRPLGAQAVEQVRGGVIFVDAGGTVASSTAWSRSQHLRAGASWRIRSASDRQWWKAFLAGRRGQLKAFLYPTWRPDLTLQAQPAGGATSIRVVEDYSALWWPSLAHRRVQLEYADGTVGRFTVASVSNGAGFDELEFPNPQALPGTIPGGSVVRVSFLETCRLAEDVVAFEYGPGWQGRVAIAALVVAA